MSSSISYSEIKENEDTNIDARKSAQMADAAELCGANKKTYKELLEKFERETLWTTHSWITSKGFIGTQSAKSKRYLDIL